MFLNEPLLYERIFELLPLPYAEPKPLVSCGYATVRIIAHVREKSEGK